MRLLGFNITRAKATAVPAPVLTPPARGWTRVLEPFTGAWQQGVEINRQHVASFGPVFACMTLIASDIGKIPPRLLRKRGAVWQEASDASLSALLRAPNAMQTWQAFATDWIMSLLRAGNTYALIDRDARGAPDQLIVLNPELVQPLVTPRGDVYYRLNADNIAGLTEAVVVPASQVLHHRINCLHHPLVGTSPLWAAGLAAQTGHNISAHAARFFGAMARPSGILTAPGHISDDAAQRLKDTFDAFRGTNAGAVAVAGDGLKFEPLAITSADAQLLEVLKLSAVQVAQAFRVPPFLIGAEPAPSVANSELLMQQYYKSCLQALIEGMESTLDRGLGLADDEAIELDAETGLLRLDTAARFASYEVAMRSGWLAPNEVRAKENLPPVVGGDSPMIQQQNFSLAALAQRDGASTPAPLPAPSAPSTNGKGALLPPPAAPRDRAPGEIVKVGQLLFKYMGGRRWRALNNFDDGGDEETAA